MNNSKDFCVTTVSGAQVPRNKCRYIKNEYYQINVDCFLMEDNCWHRINNGKIAFDYEVKKHVLIENANLREGIVGIKEDGSFAYGMFSSNVTKNTEIDTIPCISYEIAEQLNLKEKISTGTYFSPQHVKVIRDIDVKKISGKYSFPLDYSASGKLRLFSEAYDKTYVPKANNLSVLKYAQELDGKSFGFEVETHNGMIPERILVANGIIPLRDGSLKHDNVEPFEYVTVPLQGEKGLNTIVDVMEIIRKYTTIGNKCALHVHIGGYKPSKEFVISLHRVMLAVQEEIYEMFPSNYKYTSDNNFKQKDYCAPISNVKIMKRNSIDDNFSVLFNHYSGGHGRFVDFGYCNHPKDEGNRAKWSVSERYKILNCIPLIWGGSGTLEWRCHVPTQSTTKILNWLFISNAVLKYAHKHAKKIADFEPLTKLDLKTILEDVYSTGLAKILSGYIEWRKDYMKTMDPFGDQELDEDLTKPIPYTL